MLTSRNAILDEDPFPHLSHNEGMKPADDGTLEFRESDRLMTIELRQRGDEPASPHRPSVCKDHR